MKKTLVAYYSHTGSNAYLARQLARRLNADLEPIRPRLDLFGLQLFFSWIRLSFGIRPFPREMGAYDRLVLVGPIWVGQLIAPVRAAIRKYREEIPELYFATCCGSTDEIKDDRFGYETVFALAREVAMGKLAGCRAFPIALVLPEGEAGDDAIMKTRLSDANFEGEIRERLEAWVESMGSGERVSTA